MRTEDAPRDLRYGVGTDIFSCALRVMSDTFLQRPDSVTVRFQTPRGEKKAMKLIGFTARVFQHEFDHLDGVLFHDRYGNGPQSPIGRRTT